MIPLESFFANAVEASVLALGIALLSRALPLSAPLRSALWLLVLVKLLLPPLPVLPAGLSAMCRAARDAAVSAIEAPPRLAAGTEVAPPSAQPAVSLPAPAAEESAIEAADIVPVWSGEIDSAAAALPPAPAETGAPGLEAALSAAWVLGLLLLAWTRGRRVDALRALVRGGEDAPDEIHAECAALCARLGIRRPPRIRTVDTSISPFLWACGRPVIVLPAPLARAGTEDLRRAALAHELAHLARGDHRTAWIEVAATLAFWWLPTSWLVSRAHERASDEAADALAATLVSTPRSYARSLLSTIELIRMTPLPAALPGRSLGEREAVRRRLTMLFRGTPTARLSSAARLALVAIAALVLPASPRPLSSQEAAEPRFGDESVAPASATAGTGANSEDSAISQPGATPLLAPSADANRDDRRRAGGGAGLAIAGSSDDAPALVAASGSSDVDARLRGLEKRIDDLLRELQAIRSQMDPNSARAYAPTATIRSTRPAGAAQPGGPAKPAAVYGLAGAGGIRAVAPSAGAGPAVTALSVPGARSAAAGGMAGTAPGASPATDWLAPPRGDLTREQRAQIEELDKQFIERLEKHKARYAREREEAIRSILEGKAPGIADPDLQGR